MPAITVYVDSLGPRRALNRLSETLKPPVIISLISARLLEYVDESFRTLGRGKWRRLSWSTLALRQRGGDRPLQDTGRYKQSFVRESDESTFVEVGSNIKTSKGTALSPIHEFGTGPYTIRVRNARVLAAQAGSGTGGAASRGPLGLIASRRSTRWFFFGKEVHHPGIPARPVLPTSQREAEVVLQPVITGALERATQDANPV